MVLGELEMELGAASRRSKQGPAPAGSLSYERVSPAEDSSAGEGGDKCNKVMEQWQAEQLTLEGEAVASVISTGVAQRSPVKLGMCFLERQAP